MTLSTVSAETLEWREMVIWGIKRKFSKLRRFNLYILFLHMIPQIIGKTSRNFSYHSKSLTHILLDVSYSLILLFLNASITYLRKLLFCFKLGYMSIILSAL